MPCPWYLWVFFRFHFKEGITHLGELEGWQGDHSGNKESCEVPADFFGLALQVCMCIHLATGTAVALLNCLSGYKRLFALSLQEIKLGNPGTLSVAVLWLSLLD